MTNDFKPAKAGGNQPRLSKEEYAEKKRAEKEKVYQMIDDAAREIVSDPEKFKSFLDTQSRMDRYSAANALLIYSQYPQATQLKDFDDWGKDNVKITKGAKSISILEPVEYTRADGSPGISYNVKKVFDVTQTNGRKAPAVSESDRSHPPRRRHGDLLVQYRRLPHLARDLVLPSAAEPRRHGQPAGRRDRDRPGRGYRLRADVRRDPWPVRL